MKFSRHLIVESFSLDEMNDRSANVTSSNNDDDEAEKKEPDDTFLIHWIVCVCRLRSPSPSYSYQLNYLWHFPQRWFYYIFFSQPFLSLSRRRRSNTHNIAAADGIGFCCRLSVCSEHPACDVLCSVVRSQLFGLCIININLHQSWRDIWMKWNRFFSSSLSAAAAAVWWLKLPFFLPVPSLSLRLVSHIEAPGTESSSLSLQKKESKSEKISLLPAVCTYVRWRKIANSIFS